MTDAELVAAIERAQERIRRNKAHRYQVLGPDGKWNYALGVSSIIDVMDKPYLVGWAAGLAAETGDPKAHEKVKDSAGNVGKRLHAAIERECRLMMGAPAGEPLELAEDEAMALARWQRWAKDAEFRPLAVEFYVYHAGLNYAGTPDVLAYIRGRLVIGDWKTGGKRIYESHHLQSVSYRVAFADMLGINPPPGGHLVHVPRSGDRIAEGPATDSLVTSMLAFEGLRNTYLWQREIRREMDAA